MYSRSRRRQDMGRRDRLVELFHRMDTNHDRILGMREVNTYLRQNCYDEQAIMSFWQTFDLNRDGQITAEEYNRVLARLPDDSVDTERLRKVFVAFDTNNSGRLELTDVQAALNAIAADATALGSLMTLWGVPPEVGFSFEDFVRLFADPAFI